MTTSSTRISRRHSIRAPSLAVAARYVLGPRAFEAVGVTRPDDSREIQVADALRSVIAAGGHVVAVPQRAAEKRYDIGTVHSYCEAFLEHALSDPRFGPALREHARPLIDGPR